MGIWIAGAILLALAVLPLGVRIRYDCDGIAVTVLAGPVRILVFPRPKKEKKKKEDKIIISIIYHNTGILFN